jgi:hypothetical protein
MEATMVDQNREMPQLMNGLPSEAEELAVRDIKRLQDREPDPLVDGIAGIVRRAEDRAATRSVLTMAEVGVPFSQREHDLLLESVDQVASDWVNQLRDDRKSSEELEQTVLQRVAKVKTDLTQLFLLGNAVLNKVKRDTEFKAKVFSEIDKLAEEHTA